MGPLDPQVATLAAVCSAGETELRKRGDVVEHWVYGCSALATHARRVVVRVAGPRDETCSSLGKCEYISSRNSVGKSRKSFMFPGIEAVTVESIWQVARDDDGIVAGKSVLRKKNVPGLCEPWTSGSC